MKEALLTRHAVDACQRFRVLINISVLNRMGAESPPPTNSDNYLELQDEFEALENSSDGQAWKFNLTGLNPSKAREYLERDIAEIEKEERRRHLGKDGLNLNNISLEQRINRCRHEIIIPKCVTDQVKSRLPTLRNNCKNADVAFVTIKSKSHQFTKLVIESGDAQSAYVGQINVWKEVLTLCNACNAPKTGSGLFKDLGFLGGELSVDDFQLLYSLKLEGTVYQEDCEKYRELASLTHFETCHRCTIWVQAPEENLNNNRDVDNKDKAKALGKASFKVFYGCEPTRMPELWGHVRLRLADMRRGVKYWNMECDKDQLVFMTKHFDQKFSGIGSNFLEYVSKVSGASVSIDHYCRYHIRIDGSTASSDFKKDLYEAATLAAEKDEDDRRTNFAKEIIHLQIELLMEKQARQHRRLFGRDWSYSIEDTTHAELALNNTSSNQSLGSNTGNNRNVATAFMQIAEITDVLNLAETSVAAHACIILYRYLNVVSNQPTKINHVMKLRETFLACTFLANKAQKAIRWKRLEIILDAAYNMFYSGGFDQNGEEAASWEKRILAAENDIVTTLEYDIFWPGIDWITTITRESGQITASDVKTIVNLMQSGPILAAGPTLWLKLGPEYIFTAVAALLSFSIDSLLAALSISPVKLIDAVKLIITSLLSNKSNRQRSYKSKTLSEIFNLEKDTLLQKSEQIKKTYKRHTMSGNHNPAGVAKNHQSIAHQCGRRRMFPEVESKLIKDSILPSIGRIRLQSQCEVYFKVGGAPGTEDIILEGSWRSLALAEHLLEMVAFGPSKQNLLGAGESSHQLLFVSPEHPTLSSVELTPEIAEITSTVRIRGKANPCTITMSTINSKGGWNKLGDHFWRGKAGGKACLPANVSSKVLRNAGLRWRPQSTPHSTLDGALGSMLSLRCGSGTDSMTHLSELSKIAKTFNAIGEASPFPFLSSIGSGNDDIGAEDECICDPVSLQRWPAEKAEIRERSKGGMDMGISATSLQEMQLLQQLHFLIPAPQGHPNFVLPIAIASDDIAVAKVDTETIPNSVNTKNVNDFITGRSDDILSFLQPREKDSIDAEESQARGSHLVFEPIPLVLQTIISKPKKGKNGRLEAGLVPASILTTWFYDLLSALAHCHANHVVLRTLHPDQIFIDHSGVAKISGLSRSIVLNHSDRHRFLDQVASFRNKGKKGSAISDDDILSNPYMAPELLLGGSRYSQETDVWTLGCMIAHLIVSKPIFSGRDRQSKMRSIFKIVGSPSSTNYKKAEKFPYFNSCKTSKKYKSGVEKAIRFMLNSSSTDAKSYSKILVLLERMLVLDPIKRITAAGALEHKSMTDYLNDTREEGFRRTFVTDWVTLNDGLCSSLLDGIVVESDDVIKDTLSNKNREGKRRASFLEKDITENTMDTLYDMDDMMISSYLPGKRVKLNGTS